MSTLEHLYNIVHNLSTPQVQYCTHLVNTAPIRWPHIPPTLEVCVGSGNSCCAKSIHFQLLNIFPASPVYPFPKHFPLPEMLASSNTTTVRVALHKVYLSSGCKSKTHVTLTMNVDWTHHWALHRPSVWLYSFSLVEYYSQNNVMSAPLPQYW